MQAPTVPRRMFWTVDMSVMIAIVVLAIAVVSMATI